MCVRARCCFCVFALDLRDVYASFVSIVMRIFPFFHNFAIFLFLGNCNFYDKLIIGVVVAGERIDAVVAEILS